MATTFKYWNAGQPIYEDSDTGQLTFDYWNFGMPYVMYYASGTPPAPPATDAIFFGMNF